MSFTVTPRAARPNGSQDHCFYCNQKVGSDHKADCVMIDRKVRVSVTLEIDTWLPASYDAEVADFYFFESSWCADRIVNDITDYVASKNAAGDCICEDFDLEFLAWTDELRLREG